MVVIEQSEAWHKELMGKVCTKVFFPNCPTCLKPISHKTLHEWHYHVVLLTTLARQEAGSGIHPNIYANWPSNGDSMTSAITNQLQCLPQTIVTWNLRINFADSNAHKMYVFYSLKPTHIFCWQQRMCNA